MFIHHFKIFFISIIINIQLFHFYYNNKSSFISFHNYFNFIFIIPFCCFKFSFHNTYQ